MPRQEKQVTGVQIDCGERRRRWATDKNKRRRKKMERTRQQKGTGSIVEAHMRTHTHTQGTHNTHTYTEACRRKAVTCNAKSAPHQPRKEGMGRTPKNNCAAEDKDRERDMHWFTINALCSYRVTKKRLAGRARPFSLVSPPTTPLLSSFYARVPFWSCRLPLTIWC